MRGGSTRKQAQASDVRGSKAQGLGRTNYWRVVTECAGGHLGVGCRRACGRPRRASGGVASECRRTNVEARGGHRPHATTREDHQSGAGDPSQGIPHAYRALPSRLRALSAHSVVVWLVQEPAVEMGQSLSGARLKMTVLGLAQCCQSHIAYTVRALPPAERLRANAKHGLPGRRCVPRPSPLGLTSAACTRAGG